MNTEDEFMGKLIELALAEDRVEEDITTNSLLDCDRKATARITAKEKGIISGLQVVQTTIQKLDPDSRVKILKGDGHHVQAGDAVIEIRANESAILKAERTALNFLQRLSGIATLTGKFAARLKPHQITLLDTRKTTPGMRYLEKAAVRHGGGTNHRMNLEDMALVKDNHIKMAGSISRAVQKIRENFPQKKIEVEVKNLDELAEALALDVDMIMLDNFDDKQLKTAVEMRINRRVTFEISGNVTLENIGSKAVAGIDFISVGALTHSFKSLDLSLNIIHEDREDK